jgi:DNA replication protein DnaC
MSDAISNELRAILKRLKLSPIAGALPERAALARSRRMPHLDFLELVLSDEVTRRDALSTTLRARKARLDPAMVLEAWDDSSKISFDRDLWAEITTLRFMDDRNNVVIMGPVGVGKTFMANSLGHIACRRRRSVVMMRSDQMFKRLKASRLDHTYEQELRRLIRTELLIIDDFGLRDLDDTETHDFYELVVERHLKASTVITSNRDPSEWLAVMADPLLAQSAIDRLQSAAYELVVDGDSYRRRQKPRPPSRRPG